MFNGCVWSGMMRENLKEPRQRTCQPLATNSFPCYFIELPTRCGAEAAELREIILKGIRTFSSYKAEAY